MTPFQHQARRNGACIAVALFLSAGCGQSQQPIAPASVDAKVEMSVARGPLIGPSATPAAHESKLYQEEILRAAKEYRQWPRVDERAGSAPWLCAWWPATPSYVQQSAAKDGSAHGKKLYFLHASDREGYLSKAPIPVGFAIVKEAYQNVRLDKATVARLAAHPELRLDREGKYYRVLGSGVRGLQDPADQAKYGIPPELVAPFPQLEIMPAIGRPVAAPNVHPERAAPMAPPIRVVEVDGTWVRTGEQADIFVMAKVTASTVAGTDAGWVYGVVTPDGSVVRASGNLEKCAGCHASGKHERLFGSDGPAKLDE